MKQVNFIKYNRTRREEYQISTAICEDEKGKFVEKKALTRKAIKHIEELKTDSRALKDIFVNVQILEPQIAGDKATYEFLSGLTVEQEFRQRAENLDDLIEYMIPMISLIFEINSNHIKQFPPTKEFQAVFGDSYGYRGESVDIANVDLLFDNLIIKEEQSIWCLDSEWVFYFPTPINFLKYRSISYFYDKYQNLFSKRVGKTEFFAKFDFSGEDINIFESMERGFQKYVHGDNYEYQYTNRYKKKLVQLSELNQEIIEKRNHIVELKNEIEKANLRVLNLQNENVAYQDSIKKLKQHFEEEILKRDKDVTYLNELVHVKDDIIANKDILLREKDEIIQSLNLFSNRITNNLIYRILVFPGKCLRRIFPKETRRRKIMGYLRRGLRHPIKALKNNTSYNRNLIHGNLMIGSGYLEHGKVIFPYEEQPVVSIIIPVYNQVTYTYNCLRSILKNTKDIPYEIIIADDVSKDGTKKLECFTENINVIHNKSNLGFLKNCNNAAKEVRGEYILFLNNDTEVQDNWLKPLVDLITSKSDIGMVGSRLLYPDGSLQEAGGIIWRDGSGWNYGRMDDPSKPEYNYVREVDYISGASIMIRNKLWREIGGFDERFTPAYCEDSDLAFEVREHGYRVMYQPLSSVVHFEGITNGTDTNSGIKHYQLENTIKFKEKWKNVLENQYENPKYLFAAKDRIGDRKSILVIDHYVPTFDKDAGSKTTFQYLKIFLEKNYIVKFIGDNFCKQEPYTTTLEQMGIEVLYGNWYGQHIFEWIENNADNIDFVYLNRPHITMKYLDFLKEKTHAKLIYYGHDLHSLRMMREYELVDDIALKEEAQIWEKKEFEIMEKVDATYYPSYIEEEYIKSRKPEINVKAITAYVFDDFVNDTLDNFKSKEGILFVGGFSHGPNIDAVLWFVNKIYPKIKEKLNIPVYIVGSNPTEDIKELDGNGITVTGFVSEEKLKEYYKTSKIVIAPLRYGAGVKGKIIEALYYGLPVVTTPTGAEGIRAADEIMIIKEDETGFAEAILELYNNNDKLYNMSLKTQKFIKKYFTMDTAWKIIQEDFQ